VRFLTPTENKRLNELIGFVCIAAAVLVSLSLISYSPHDPALNVSAASLAENPVRNWIGPVGSYTADLSFQIFGFAAFLLPLAIGLLGYRWFRSRAVDSQWATLVGYALLLLSLPSLLALTHFPEVRGAIPAGGLLGVAVSHGLQSGFNFWGALLVAMIMIVVALFLTTSFSFSGAHAWASSSKGPLRKMGTLGILQRARARWEEWREDREEARMRREVEERKLSGRKPVAPQIVGRTEKPDEGGKTIRLEEAGDIFKSKKAAVVEEDEEEETGET
jgi:DNA segregation ATPase FtsK/SpoIIIE, S-DNA-T family